MNDPQNPILSLEELEAFDPHGPPGRKWCPLCGEGKPKDAAHRSLSLDAQSGLWKCFRCGASGKVRERWEDKPFVPPRERARQRLRSVFTLPPITLEPSTFASESVKLSTWEEHWNATEPLATTPGEAYLQRRGISCEVAELARVRFGRRWNAGASVVFPLVNRSGKVVAVQGRGVRDARKITYGPKREGVFEAPIRLGTRVYDPWDAAVPAIIVTEAPIDALSLAVCGFPAVALCGTSGPSWFHIAGGLRRIMLAFDADEAGDEAARSMTAWLSPFGARCERLRPQGFKDWNDWLVGGARDELELVLSTSLIERA